MDLACKISEAFNRLGLANKPDPHGDDLYFDDENGNPIFWCSVRADAPTAHISTFEMEEAFKGRKLSTIVLQTIAKHFEEAGAKYIGIYMIRNDGLSFWPRFGAMKDCGAPSQRSYAQPFIEDKYVALYGKFLGAAYDIAGDDVTAAWYYITDPKTKAPRELIERLNIRSHESSMYMDLSHAQVRERLGLD